MDIDLHQAEAALQNSYRANAAQYRYDDEIEVQTPHHQRLAGNLAAISSSFGRRISVLDVGCGTGRFFYCLRNVDRLVGMDISPEMLLAAEQPVYREKITARTVQLIQGNAFFASFEPQSFDLIYSFGMFGHGCPVTVDVCNKFYSWLAPGGQLYFDTVDVRGVCLSRRLKWQLRKMLYHALPPKARRALDQREGHTPFFGLTRRQLNQIMRQSRFPHFAIVSEICHSPLWKGRHLECRAGVSAFQNFTNITPPNSTANPAPESPTP